jgi:hypothetical protein
MAFTVDTDWRAAAENVALEHMRWRHMCLFAIEDHRDLEDFDRLDGLADVVTVLVAIPLVRGNLERGILWRAAYHELEALRALRRAGLAGYSRAREAALREFLGFDRSGADLLTESEIAEPAVVIASAEDDKPPGLHPPETSGSPPCARVTRTRTRRTRRGGHGGASYAVARGAAGSPAVVR